MKVKKYTKIPVEIEAIIYNGKNSSDIRKFTGMNFINLLLSAKTKEEAYKILCIVNDIIVYYGGYMQFDYNEYCDVIEDYFGEE